VSAADGVEIGFGGLLVVVTLYDVFQSVVMPRPAVGRVRVSVSLIQIAWRVWRVAAERPRRLQTREAALAAFAPMMVVALLTLWGFALILGYALIYSALRDGLHPQPDSLATSIYFSAGRMLAFPVGGIEATGVATRILTGLEAAGGFGLFALVISLLFSLFTSFQRREAAVVALDALAGAPPSGVQLLENCAKEELADQLTATFDAWRIWSVEVLESHLSYPLLFYFRSSHDNEAWPNSFGAIMDAAILVISAVEGGPAGHARLMYKNGLHLVEDMRHFFFGFREAQVRQPGVERHEFVEACDRLRHAGYRIRELEPAWKEFGELRSRYGRWLNVTTKSLGAPPAPWIGDRSYLPHRDGGRRARALRPVR
jgi:hypothetical protein